MEEKSGGPFVIGKITKDPLLSGMKYMNQILEIFSAFYHMVFQSPLAGSFSVIPVISDTGSLTATDKQKPVILSPLFNRFQTIFSKYPGQLLYFLLSVIRGIASTAIFHADFHFPFSFRDNICLAKSYSS